MLRRYLIESVTQYEHAHQIAQRNAALPIEQGGLGLHSDNTPIDRANAMGFNTLLYHGTNHDFENFDKSKIGSSTDHGIRGHGIYFTNDPKTASAYGNRIHQVKIKIENPLDLLKFKNKDELANHLGVDPYIFNERETNGRRSILVRHGFSRVLSSEAKYKGYDSILHGDEHVIFDPNRIRSIHAAFDPMRQHESDLLA